MPHTGTMWHCYECNAEMRPLMMPDPHCASCNSTFVEMIESESDDPRNFQVSGLGVNHDDDDEPFGGGYGGGINPENPLDLFQTLMLGLGGPQRRASTIRIDRRTNPNAPADTSISFGGGGGGPQIMGTVPPPGGFFIHSTTGGSPGGQGDADMTPFLATMFGGPIPPSGGGEGQGAQLPPNPIRSLLASLFGAPMGSQDGQFGDYAVTNEALDRIITQLMEQSNGDKPVPAPDDMIERLPRSKVQPGSELLEKDCAVCKDDFEVTQDTIQLPCKHVFHDECILPWIKQSGTCPVCRHELVPQPKHAPTAPGAGGAGPSSGDGAGGGLFSMFRGSGNSNNSSSTSNSSSGSPPNQNNIPGGWHDLD